MKKIKDFISEALGDVYAIVDFSDAIQGVFDTKADADAALAKLPKEAEAKVKKMNKSEVMATSK